MPQALLALPYALLCAVLLDSSSVPIHHSLFRRWPDSSAGRLFAPAGSQRISPRYATSLVLRTNPELVGTVLATS